MSDYIQICQLPLWVALAHLYLLSDQILSIYKFKCVLKAYIHLCLHFSVWPNTEKVSAVCFPSLATFVVKRRLKCRLEKVYTMFHLCLESLHSDQITHLSPLGSEGSRSSFMMCRSWRFNIELEPLSRFLTFLTLLSASTTFYRRDKWWVIASSPRVNTQSHKSSPVVVIRLRWLLLLSECWEEKGSTEEIEMIETSGRLFLSQIQSVCQVSTPACQSCLVCLFRSVLHLNSDLEKCYLPFSIKLANAEWLMQHNLQEQVVTVPFICVLIVAVWVCFLHCGSFEAASHSNAAQRWIKLQFYVYLSEVFR